MQRFEGMNLDDAMEITPAALRKPESAPQGLQGAAHVDFEELLGKIDQL